MRSKRDFWQMIVFGAVMSGRQTVNQATATADEAVKAYESRRKEWDEEETRYTGGERAV